MKDKQLRALWQFLNNILPAYKDYISQDKTLEDDSKRIRINSANLCMELMETILEGK